jgi:hypothetical protein
MILEIDLPETIVTDANLQLKKYGFTLKDKLKLISQDYALEYRRLSATKNLAIDMSDLYDDKK